MQKKGLLVFEKIENNLMKKILEEKVEPFFKNLVILINNKNAVFKLRYDIYDIKNNEMLFSQTAL